MACTPKCQKQRRKSLDLTSLPTFPLDIKLKIKLTRQYQGWFEIMWVFLVWVFLFLVFLFFFCLPLKFGVLLQFIFSNLLIFKCYRKIVVLCVVINKYKAAFSKLQGNLINTTVLLIDAILADKVQCIGKQKLRSEKLKNYRGLCRHQELEIIIRPLQGSSNLHVAELGYPIISEDTTTNSSEIPLK